MKFSELNLHPQIQTNLTKLNFTDCTPIQEHSIPIVRSGKDLAGLAQTGTGKTAAFLLPMIERILRGIEAGPTQVPDTDSAPDGSDESTPLAPSVQVKGFANWQKRQFILILVPTRELAEQVYKNAEMFCEGTNLSAVAIYGGTSYDHQKKGLKDGVEFVIATPGRLIDLFKEHLVDLRQVRAVVFDEADRMFDMGFKDDMKFILKRLPRERQFLVFSATMNFDVLNVAYEFGADPVEVNISKDQPKAENVRDELFHVGQEEKPAHLLSLLRKHNPKQVIIFSNFKRNIERIAVFLNRNGFAAMGISSLLTQAQRARVMSQFKAENDRNILIATDLAARGLDILGVDMVVNYDLPDDPENYVHRIGRTGRAGQTGVAFSLVSDRDVDALSRIEDYLGHKVATGWLETSDISTEYQPFPSEYELERKKKGPPSSHGPGRGGPRRGGEQRGRPRPHSSQQNRPQHQLTPRNPDAESAQTPESTHRDRQLGRHHNANRNPNRDQQPRRDRHQNPRPHRSGPQQGSGRRHDGPRPHRSQQGPNFRRPERQNGIDIHRRPSQPNATAASLGQKVSSFFRRLFGAE